MDKAGLNTHRCAIKRKNCLWFAEIVPPQNSIKPDVLSPQRQLTAVQPTGDGQGLHLHHIQPPNAYTQGPGVGKAPPLTHREGGGIYVLQAGAYSPKPIINSKIEILFFHENNAGEVRFRKE